MSLVAKIKELKRALELEFPEGGVSISVVALGKEIEPEPEPEHEKEEEGIRPGVRFEELEIKPVKPGDLRKLLNTYAQTHGPEKAFNLVESLTTDKSRNPDMIPVENHIKLVRAAVSKEG